MMRLIMVTLLMLIGFVTINSSSYAEQPNLEKVRAEFYKCYESQPLASLDVVKESKIFEACAAQFPKSYTNQTMSSCSRETHKVWDVVLNKEYRRVLATFDVYFVGNEIGLERTTNKLKKAQRAWITYRDLECDSQGDRYSLVTGFNSSRGGHISLTQKRVLELRRTLSWFRGRGGVEIPN